MDNKQTTFMSVIHFCKRSMINGLLTVMPLALTFGLFALSFRIITSWLEPIQTFITHPLLTITTIPYSMYIQQIILFTVIILITGIIVRALILQQLITMAENGLFKLPLVRPIYSAVRQLINAFSSQDKFSFKQVVLVEFPRAGIYSIGFLTSEFPKSVLPTDQKIFYNIFIPTTPNPTSGFLVIVPQEMFTHLDLTRQEAMTLIISGGIVQPERFTQ